MRFFDFLFPPRVDEAALRDVSDDQFLADISPRLVSATRPGTVALLPFSSPAVRAAIHEAKYHGSERAFALLGTALAEYLLDADDRLRRASLVPVPLAPGRRRKRGFNQVEEIARGALRTLGSEWPGRLDLAVLSRVRDTVSQVSLPRHTREENMRHAFLAERADPASTYILIDDVITTGATLQAAIDALMAAGAAHVHPIALAH